MNEQDKLKKIAAEKAVESVESGMVLGLGTGSTVYFALKRLGELLKSGGLEKIVGIPSSKRTEKLALEFGIPLTTFDEKQSIDLTIDGADEADEKLNLIKGGGGALLREKIIAQNGGEFICVIDESKMSKTLGEKWALPVEVIPFAKEVEKKYLESLGAKVSLRKDEAGKRISHRREQRHHRRKFRFNRKSGNNRR